MFGPNASSVRPPAVAGLFYPDDPNACRTEAGRLLGLARHGRADSAGRPALGAIVPHAGWACSGKIAGEAIATLARGRAAAVDLVVVFGAIHTPAIRPHRAAADVNDTWQTPDGLTELDGELIARLCADERDWFTADERLHRREHAIEVEVPLLRAACPGARLLPIETPADDRAVEVGRRVAEHCLAERAADRVVFLASSDLTHYGPAYGFAPVGAGLRAVAWAMENDRRLLRRIERMEVESIVPEAREHHNACGAGAIAAMLAACRVAGGKSVELLRHTSSFETLAGVAPQPPVNSVGYAAVVVR